MPKERASFFDDIPEIDLSVFSPEGKEEGRAPAPPPEKVKAVAKAANFPSRESSPPHPKPLKTRTPRIYRTGRNVQFSAKARRETVETFYAITDKQGWVLGETLDRAIAALQRELDAKP